MEYKHIDKGQTVEETLNNILARLAKDPTNKSERQRGPNLILLLA